MTEQSPSIIPLLALAILIGIHAWSAARDHEWPQYSGPMCEFKGKPLPRGEDGRARFDYFWRCKDD